MRAVVTGGAGFIGSRLSEMLVERGHQVGVMDNLSTGLVSNVPERSSFVRCDLGSGACPRIEETDVVFHLAALPLVPESVDDPAACRKSGDQATFEVLGMALAGKVGRVVFASSCAVYGNVGGVVREDAPIRPVSPYAASKAAGEAYARSWASCYDIDCVSLRLFNVYGPRQRSNSSYCGVVARFCDALAGDGHVTIHGGGAQSRDFVYVDDVAEAMILAAEHPKPFGGAAFNVGTGRGTSVLDVLDAVEKAAGVKAIVTHEPKRAGDVDEIRADASEAEKFGFWAKTRLEDGICRTFEWYRTARLAQVPTRNWIQGLW